MAITERSPGVWRVIVWGTQRPDGTRPRLTATVHGRRNARDKERELLNERDKGKLPASRSSLSAYLETYLYQRRAEIAPATHARYTQLAEVNIAPVIGGLRLSEVYPPAVRHLYRQLSDEGLAPRTVGHVHRFLSMALKRAVLDGLIASDPCGYVKPPKVERTEPDVLDAAYAFKLLHDLGGTSVWLPAKVALATGLREGEMLALKWANIDLKRGTLTVTHSMEQIGSSLRRKETKTKTSRRTVPLTKSLVRDLEQHRRMLKESRLRLANFWDEQGYVFPSQHHVGEHKAGRAWSPQAFKAAWRKATRDAGWTIRFHDLRHTWATAMLRNAVPIETVAKLGGWASTQVLLGTYSHAVAADDSRVTDVAEAMLG